MTTTANKQGLKAAAKARTEKHAQRTLLPPKAGSIAEAAQPFGDSSSYGRMTVVELHARAQTLGLQMPKSATKGRLLDAILKAEQAAPVEAPKPKANGKGPTNTDHNTLDGADDKSLAKANKFRDAVVAHGWTVNFLVPADRPTVVEAVAERGPEAIHIAWGGGVCEYESLTYTYGDRVVKPRNASGAKQMAARAPEEAASILERVASNKAWKKKEPAERKPVKLPFDPALATDMEVVEALAGQAVRWHNRLSGGEETAAVTKDRKRITVEDFEGDRVIKFLCPHTGFRAFRLSALRAVGRVRGVTTKGQSRVGVPMKVEIS